MKPSRRLRHATTQHTTASAPVHLAGPVCGNLVRGPQGIEGLEVLVGAHPVSMLLDHQQVVELCGVIKAFEDEVQRTDVADRQCPPVTIRERLDA